MIRSASTQLRLIGRGMIASETDQSDLSLPGEPSFAPVRSTGRGGRHPGASAFVEGLIPSP